MSELISVRLKKEIVKEIDEIVSRGIFPSRNEALNFLMILRFK
ncbi:ribbon-helix-helix protein, CopG family [Saccharolobus solfataricus]|uniref:Ribbon-helix-helix protein, CopG family n=2 Tax=Saccharolobus solfataricus TaxID=2287 RepID=A0A3G2LQQ9_SACSO|nr:ribbon-helix-helix protein, CopG family [Saccharolobus solfataricus]AYN75626.1 ribbon-helix-helix protein, CopG family [Saccharolobus solfataricus]AYN75788.1 ribbon-helix-helix protein, CopG family [Saccharolobus solfataricus]AYP18623.1 ribbon-helix-helix protein, CopG family [Saccharolobus solfataricus]AZF69158.1 ribbon-helix-helix protein, CopG family [Saccharolobus solfataricus]AZF71778.1 ribbon-helix-helix protein, CopG family [Saccharolobus solfataricus]